MKVPRIVDYPSHIDVGVAKVPYKLKWVSGKKWLGKCSYAKRTIYLSDWLTKEQAFMVLLHESLHAIDFEMDLGLKHKHVYALEEGLYLLLKNNLKQLTLRR